MVFTLDFVVSVSLVYFGCIFSCSCSWFCFLVFLLSCRSVFVFVLFVHFLLFLLSCLVLSSLVLVFGCCCSSSSFALSCLLVLLSCGYLVFVLSPFAWPGLVLSCIVLSCFDLSTFVCVLFIVCFIYLVFVF
jgi:hypothetical protein